MNFLIYYYYNVIAINFFYILILNTIIISQLVSIINQFIIKMKANNSFSTLDSDGGNRNNVEQNNDKIEIKQYNTDIYSSLHLFQTH